MRQICRQTLQPRENAAEIKSSSISTTPAKQSQRPAHVAVLEGDEQSTSDQEMHAAQAQSPSTAPVQVAGGKAKKGTKKGKTVAAVPPPPAASSKVTKVSPQEPAPASPVLPVHKPAPASHEITIHVKAERPEKQHGKGFSHQKQWNGDKWHGKGKGFGKGGAKGQNFQWQDQNVNEFGAQPDSQNVAGGYQNASNVQYSMPNQGARGNGKGRGYPGGKGGGRGQSNTQTGVLGDGSDQRSWQ